MYDDENVAFKFSRLRRHLRIHDVDRGPNLKNSVGRCSNSHRCNRGDFHTAKDNETKCCRTFNGFCSRVKRYFGSSFRFVEGMLCLAC